MRKFLLSFVPLIACSILFAQYNFSFENFKPGTDTLSAWNIRSGAKFAGATVSIDETVKHSGKYSLSIERKDADTVYKFSVVRLKIPVNFSGNNLVGSCWLKTQDVKKYTTM